MRSPWRIWADHRAALGVRKVLRKSAVKLCREDLTGELTVAQAEAEMAWTIIQELKGTGAYMRESAIQVLIEAAKRQNRPL
jgi:hypothetical protein